MRLPTISSPIFLALLTLILSFTTAVKINCDSSAMCWGCKHPLDDLIHLTTNLSDTATFSNGAQVACASCHIVRREGSCVFLKHLADRQTVTGAQVKDALARLKRHNCWYCGSAPVWVDGGDAVVVVDYVTDSCVKHGSKVCKAEWLKDGGEWLIEEGPGGLSTLSLSGKTSSSSGSTVSVASLTASLSLSSSIGTVRAAKTTKGSSESGLEDGKGCF